MKIVNENLIESLKELSIYSSNIKTVNDISYCTSITTIYHHNNYSIIKYSVELFVFDNYKMIYYKNYDSKLFNSLRKSNKYKINVLNELLSNMINDNKDDLVGIVKCLNNINEQIYNCCDTNILTDEFKNTDYYIKALLLS